MTTDLAQASTVRKPWRPWRSPLLGWLVTAAFLIAGIPLFVRMPPWCDVTLYEVAAHNIRTGGVHYRDVFDTNLPGFVWLLVLIRSVFGPGWEVLRLIDLAIVAMSVGVLIDIARRAGATTVGVAWMAAAAASFYPFTNEFNHMQRDVWMLLPATLAVRLRLRRMTYRQASYWGAFAEGLLWATAVWIKPHVIVPAGLVWLVSIRRVAPSRGGVWRDIAGNLSAGLLCGAAGLTWIIASGAGPAFEDVMRKWNADYGTYIFNETGARLKVELFHFMPLSWLVPVAAVMAIINIARGLSTSADPIRTSRAVVAALTIGWMLQAVLLQRMFPYVHVPEILLLLTLGAANRRSWASLAVGWCIVTGLLWVAADRQPAIKQFLWREFTVQNGAYNLLTRHPVCDPPRMSCWPECFDGTLTEEQRRRRQADLAMFPNTFASIDPVETLELANELRRLGVTDGEVASWHNTTHAVFIDLQIRPAFRFMHIEPAYTTEQAYERMKIELIRKQPAIKYVLTDSLRVWAGVPADKAAWQWEAGPHLLPPRLPAHMKAVWPMNQPAIFRTNHGHGRFMIHRNVIPLTPWGDCTVPDWAGLPEARRVVMAARCIPRR